MVQEVFDKRGSHLLSLFKLLPRTYLRIVAKTIKYLGQFNMVSLLDRATRAGPRMFCNITGLRLVNDSNRLLSACVRLLVSGILFDK